MSPNRKPGYKLLQVQVHPKLYERFKATCARNGVPTMSGMVRQLMQIFVDNEAQNDKDWGEEPAK